jgi:hypothetical protein
VGSPTNRAPSSCADRTAIGQGAESPYLGNSFFRAVNDYHPVVRGAGTASAQSQPCGVAFGWTPIEASRAIAMLDLRETSG